MTSHFLCPTLCPSHQGLVKSGVYVPPTLVSYTQTNVQNTKSQPQNTKTKTKTPNTIPDNTLQNNQCRYCKEEGHIAKECPKIAKRQKLDNDPDAPRCAHCNTTGHEELNCYFGANMENRPPKWTLTETQTKTHS